MASYRHFKDKHGYLKDRHWYFAFAMAGIFWAATDSFIQPASVHNLFQTPEIIFFSILLYPILEEIVFRGLIQSQLKLWVSWCFWGMTGANILTSVLFSLLHFIHQPPLMAALIFFPSLVFGYFRDRHHSIFPSIWLHVFYNAGFLLLFLR